MRRLRTYEIYKSKRRSLSNSLITTWACGTCIDTFGKDPPSVIEIQDSSEQEADVVIEADVIIEADVVMEVDDGMESDDDLEADDILDTDDSLDAQIKRDIRRLRSESLTIKNLSLYQIKDWLKARPKALVDILEELCGIGISGTERDYAKVCFAIEVIYGCRSPNLILPLSFLKNLILGSTTHSKNAVEVESRLTPGGSYSTIENMMISAATEPKKFPECDVKESFDNAQKVGKSYSLVPQQKQPSSVATVHTQLVFPNSFLQFERKHKPKKYLYKKVTDTVIKNATLGTDMFEQFRNELLTKRLSLAQKCEQLTVGVATKRDWMSSVRFCLVCNYENERNLKKCRVCDSMTLETREFELAKFLLGEDDEEPNPEFQLGDHSEDAVNGESDEDEMEVDDSHLTVNPLDSNIILQQGKGGVAKLVIGDPDLLNPNSYENIIHILRNIGFRAGAIFFLVYTAHAQ